MNITKSFNASHGLVFISDSKDKGTSILDTGAKNVTFTDTCIAVWVIHEVDGTATVQLTDEAGILALQKIFDGLLSVQSGIVSISQPNHTSIAEINVGAKIAKIAIYSNDETNPNYVIVQVEPLT